MRIYIDAEYKCHATDDGNRREYELDFFNGKCEAFIEGYRYIPPGEVYVGEDGTEYQGEQVSPWRDHKALLIAQLEYELADADAGLTELGVI